jgi:hypothetical protein
MFAPYKSKFQEFTAHDNLPADRASDRLEDDRTLEEKIPLISEYLKSRGIKVRDVYMTQIPSKGLCIQVVGGSQYDTEISKAVKMYDLDVLFDLKRIHKKQVTQTDDYKYYVPLRRMKTDTEFQLYNSEDQKY